MKPTSNPPSIYQICNAVAPPGAQAMATETLQDPLAGRMFTETIIRWGSTAEAANSIRINETGAEADCSGVSNQYTQDFTAYGAGTASYQCGSGPEMTADLNEATPSKRRLSGAPARAARRQVRAPEPARTGNPPQRPREAQRARAPGRRQAAPGEDQKQTLAADRRVRGTPHPSPSGQRNRPTSLQLPCSTSDPARCSHKKYRSLLFRRHQSTTPIAWLSHTSGNSHSS